MNWPGPELIGAAYGLSEFALSIRKRSSGGNGDTDRGSLLLLWGAIMVAVTAAILASRFAPWAHSSLLARAYGVGVLVFVLGLALRWYAILHLGRFFTVDVAIASDHRVVDDGPYRWVRHPSYTGAIVAFAGFGICLGNWLSLALLVVLVGWAFARRIVVEEAALTAALGDAYRAYAARTRRLVPGVY